MARSGLCPTTGQRNRIVYDDTPPLRDQKDVPIPDATFSACSGGTNVEVVVPPRDPGDTTIIEKCCPSPGPPGPSGGKGDPGDPGEGVPVGGTIGQVLSKLDATDYNAEWRDTHELPIGGLTGEVITKISDNDYDYNWAVSGAGDVTWRGYWQEGILYEDGDIVSHESSSFVCNIEHTSDIFSEPNKEFDDNPGGFEWSLLSSGPTLEEQGLLDDLFDGIVDWVADIGDWGYEDYLLALAAGAGLIWIGVELVDQFTQDGEGDADSNYTGDPIFLGTGTLPTLQELVSKICDHAEILNYDVSLLPNKTVQVTLPNLTSARAILKTLSNVFFFDMVDSEGILKFVPRETTSSVRTLTTNDDLGWTQNNTGSSPIQVKRFQGIDLPRIVQVSYISEANAYNNATQEARLETFNEGQTSVIQLPLTLTDTEAFETAEKLLINSHIERVSYSFTSTYKHIDLEPSDIITVENIGDVRILRIDETKEGLLDFQCVNADFNVANYEPSGLPAAVIPIVDDIPVSIGFSGGLTVELPPLDATDIEQRLSIATHGYGKAGWPGAAIYASTDGGISYTQLTNTNRESTWGKVATPIAAVTNHYVWDETTIITVELKTGVLSSVPEIDVYNSTNWCLIGEEVIGFKNAVLIATNTYELSGLLRGRRGTDAVIDSHVADELFLLIDNALVELPYPADFKEKIYFLKFVTNGSDISKATPFQAQPSQKSRRPWRVANLQASKAGNDWDITWIGKNQFNGELTDSGTQTQPNGFGGFTVSILDTGDNNVRSVVTQSTNLLYSEADQIADFGAIQPTLNIRIAQIDRLFGPGYNITQTF